MSILPHPETQEDKESQEDLFFWVLVFTGLLTLLFCVGMVCFMLGVMSV